MGADYYESEEQRAQLMAAGRLPIGIGAGSVISNTIVDKNARIGEKCTIINKDGIEEANRENEGFYIRCTTVQMPPFIYYAYLQLYILPNLYTSVA